MRRAFSVSEHASGTVLRALAGHLEAILNPGGARAVMVRPVSSALGPVLLEEVAKHVPLDALVV